MNTNEPAGVGSTEPAKSGGAGFAGAGSGHERRLDGAHQGAEVPALPAPGADMSLGSTELTSGGGSTELAQARNRGAQNR